MDHRFLTKHKGILILLLSIFVLGVTLPVYAQGPSKVWVTCANGRVEVEFTEWLPNEVLTAYADDAEVGSYTTSGSGGGRYQFPYAAVQVKLARANGDVIVAGSANCNQPPPGEISEVSQYQVTVPVGGKVELSAKGVDSNGNPIEPPIIWATESGSFTPEGEFTGTEEGEFVITANLIGDRSSYAYQINATVTPPLVSLTVQPAEIIIFPNQGIGLEVIAIDQTGNQVLITPDWDTGGAGEIVPMNFFIAGMEIGEYALTASVAGTDLTASVQVQVIAPIANIQILPEIEEILVGETQEFTVIGFDADGSQVPVPVPPAWTAEIGIIDANGKYAAVTAGDESIQATVDLNAIQAWTGKRGLAGKTPPMTTMLHFKVTLPPVETEEVNAADMITGTLDSDPELSKAETEDHPLQTGADQGSEGDGQYSDGKGDYRTGDYCFWCDRLVCWQRIVIYIGFWTLIGILLFGLPKWLRKKIPGWSDWHWKVQVTAFGIMLVIVAAITFTICYW